MIEGGGSSLQEEVLGARLWWLSVIRFKMCIPGWWGVIKGNEEIEMVFNWLGGGLQGSSIGEGGEGNHGRQKQR